MSEIERISIQGIRSFEPNKPQILEFFKPVTLILGQNGSGKTTIIECLKYATTGDLPPGSKTGASFIHDPKIAGETEVKAKVGLEFRDTAKCDVVVSRCVKAVQKPTQVSMQTLDSSLKRRLIDGKEVSISSRCGDLDQQLSQLLGVSKAVLENVIFCHQEESNWPLNEAKQVKEKFDDLFNSTKYVKALDSIRKTKTNKEDEMKTFKNDMKFLQKDKDEAFKKNIEKEKLEADISKITRKIDGLKGSLSPIEDQLKKYQTEYNAFCHLEMELKSEQNKKELYENQIMDLRKNLSKPISGTIDELEQKLAKADSVIHEKKQQINHNELDIKRFEKEIDEWNRKTNEMLEERGRVGTEIDNHKRLKDRLNKLLLMLANDLNLPYDESSPTLMIKQLEDHINSEESKFNSDKERRDDEIDKIKSKINSMKMEREKLKHEIDIHDKNKKDRSKELIVLEKKLKSIDDSSSKIDEIDNKLSSLTNELSEYSSRPEFQNLEEELTTLSNKMTLLDNDFQSKSQEFEECRKKENIVTELETFTNQKNEKSNNAKRYRSRHMESLETIFNGNVPPNNLKSLLTSKLSDTRIKIRELQNELTNKQTLQATNNAELRQLRNKITEQNEMVRKFDESLSEISGDVNFGNAFAQVKERKMSLEEDISNIQGTLAVYRKFEGTLKRQTPDCPLCHREFCGESEVSDLLDEVTQKLTSIPLEIEKKSNELVKINEKFEALIKLETRSAEVSKIKSTLLKASETAMENKKSEINEIQSEIQRILKLKDDCAKIEKLCSDIQSDIAVMEKLNEEVGQLEKKISILNGKLEMSKDEFKSKFETLEKEKSDFKRNLEYEKQNFNAKRRMFDEFRNKKHVIEQKLNKLEAEKLEIQGTVQQLTSLCAEKDRLKRDFESLLCQIDESEQKLKPIETNLTSKEDELAKFESQSKNLDKQNQNKINGLRIKSSEQMTLLNEIKKFDQEKYMGRLMAIENEKSQIQGKIDKNNEFINEKKEFTQSICANILNDQRQRGEYASMIKIREHESTLSVTDEDIAAIRLKIGDMNMEVVKANQANLERERNSLKAQIEEYLCQSNSLNGELNGITKDLSGHRLSKAHERYMDVVYKLKITELMVDDLEKYYKALDKAIMSYHSIKMAEVNKILKELWRNTYSGKDIDFIEICSDEEKNSLGSKRKVYSYRVVMVKFNSGVRLDMRGRCSAGQKVLASLLIRLALAEVFCLQCGMLALDEPTTNLDQENIENLAYALVEIIKTRSKQKNFQLIIITHDEDFVQLLGRSDYVDEFYKIQCSSRGYSMIEKVGIDHRV